MPRYKCLIVFVIVILSACEKSDKTWVPYWQETSQMTVARAGAAYVIHRGFVYAVAGVDGRDFLSTVERAQILADGSLGEWQIVSQLPEPRGFISAAVRNNRLYVVGGGNGPYGKHLLNSVVSASIDKNGEIGAWRTEDNTMLIPRRCAKIFITEERLYAVGGFGGTLLDTVESAPFAANGKLGEWRLSTEKLTTPRYVNELKKINNQAFAIGGHSESSGKGVASVEYLDINKLSGSWREVASLNTGRYAFASTVVNQTIYVMGGLSGAEYLDSIEFAESVSLSKNGGWRNGISLPDKMANFSALTVDGRIYLFGGSTRNKYLKNVRYASINESGDIGSWVKTADLKKIEKQKKKPEINSLPNRGVVQERIDAADYTYMRIKNDSGEIWIAAPKNAIPINSTVKYSEGVYMTNFYSKSLAKSFAAVLFVGTVLKE